jgi:hypothetical protein
MPYRERSYAAAAILCAVAIAVLFTGCPNPIDLELSLEVQDQIPPTIAITNPEPGVVVFYGQNLVIEGIVTDSATEADDNGQVSSLFFEGVTSAFLNGEIPLGSDGSFTLTIPKFVLNEYSLSGNQRFLLIATDWNNNMSETEVVLYDRATGPIIVLSSPDPGPGLYSSAEPTDLHVTGVVEVPYENLRYTVEHAISLTTLVPETGVWPPPTAEGDFDFYIDVGANSIAGPVVVYLISAGNGLNYQVQVGFDDDPVAPEVSGSILNNTSIHLDFSEPVYGPDQGDITESDMDIALTYPSGHEPLEAEAISFGTFTIPAGSTSATIPITVTDGTPSGSEGLQVMPSSVTDLAGNSGTPVTVTLTGTLQDLASPLITSVTTTLADNTSVRAGDTVPIAITFSEPLVVNTPDPVLQLSLDTGGPAVASYTGLSPDDTLNFTYTVETGDNAGALATSSLTASLLDADGNDANLNMLPLDRTIFVDTAPPVMPTVTIEDGSDDTINIAENGGNLLRIALNATGAGEAVSYTTSATNATVVPASGSLGGATTDLQLTASGTGSASVTVTVYDEVGNSTTAPAATAGVDLVAPSVPTITIEGVLTGETDITDAENPTTVTLSGGESGDTITITNMVNASIVGSPPGAFDGSGTATFLLNAMSDGLLSFDVIVTDPHDNSITTGASANADLTLPTIMLSVSDGGTGGYANDGWINIDEQGTSVLRIASGTDDTFDWVIDSITGGSVTMSGTATGGYVDLPISSISGTLLSVDATITDGAGNDNSSSVDVDIDLVAPSYTVSGSYGVDGIVNGLEDPATVTISGGDPGDALLVNGLTNATVIGVAPVLDGTGGEVFMLDVLGDGAVSYTVTVTDPAGNDTATTENLDADLYLTLTLAILDNGAGVYEDDGWINIDEQGTSVLRISCSTDSTFDWTIDSVTGATGPAASSTGTATGGVQDLPITGISGPTLAFDVTITDGANTLSDSVSIDVDLAAPNITVSNDYGPDNMINASEDPATITVSGGGVGDTLEVGGLARATVSGVDSPLDGTDEDFTLDVTSDGMVSYTVTVTDQAGNDTVVTETPTADRTIAGAAVIVDNGTGAFGDDGWINIDESGSSVFRITSSSDSSFDWTINTIVGATGPAASSTGTATGGTQDLAITGITGPTVTISVTISDAAGNTIVDSDSVDVDLVAPSIIVTNDYGADDVINASEDPAIITVSGGEAGDTLVVDNLTRATVSGVDSPLDGSDETFTLDVFADGAVSYTVTVTDPAGNDTAVTETPSADRTIDCTVTILDNGTGIYEDDGWINIDEQSGAVLRIESSTDGTFDWTIDSATGATGPTASSTGTATGGVQNLAITGVTGPTVSFSVTISDAAGNSTSDSDSVDVDLSAPSITVTNDYGVDNIINAAEDPATITVSGGGAGDTLVVDGLTNATVSGVDSPLDGSDEDFTLDVIGDGGVSYTVTVTDPAGNDTSVTETPDADINLTLTLSILDGGSGAYENDGWINIDEEGTSVLRIASSTDSTFDWTIDSVTGATGPAASSTGTATGGVENLAISGVSAPTVSFDVTISDGANSVSDSVSVSVDLIAPNITVTNDYGVDDIINASEDPATITVSGGGAGDTLVVDNLTRATVSGVDSPLDGSDEDFTLDVTADGAVVYRVTVTDPAGNDTTVTETPDADRTLTLALSILDGGSGIYENDGYINAAEASTSSLRIASSSDGSFDWEVDSITGAAVASSSGSATGGYIDLALSSVVDGAGSATVTITDAAGNETSDTVTWFGAVTPLDQPTVYIDDEGDERISGSEFTGVNVDISGGERWTMYSITTENCTPSPLVTEITLGGGGGGSFRIGSFTENSTVTVSISYTDMYGNTSEGSDDSQATVP